MAPRITISPVVMAAALMLLTSCPLLAGAVVKPEEAIGMPDCDITCGDMKVPYPFGMGAPSCYWPGFNLTCDRTGKTPRLLLGDGSLQVQDLDFAGSLLSVTHTGEIKTDANGSGWLGGGLRDDGPYMLSYDSELVLTGCNVRATVEDGGGATISSCSSVCEAGHEPVTYVPSRLQGQMLCTTIGCCQADIVMSKVAAASKLSYSVKLQHFGGNISADLERLPARVFVATKGWFRQPSVSDELLQTSRLPSQGAMAVPVSLTWEVVGHGAEPDSNATSESEVCPENAAISVCSAGATTASAPRVQEDTSAAASMVTRATPTLPAAAQTSTNARSKKRSGATAFVRTLWDHTSARARLEPMVTLPCPGAASLPLQAFLLDGDDQPTITGCTSFCPINRSTGSAYASRQVPSGGSDRYCYGIGCCQARISLSPNNMPESWVITIIDENHTTQGKNSSPAAMLITAEGWFDQRQAGLRHRGPNDS